MWFCQVNEFRSEGLAILEKGFLAKGWFLVLLGFKIAYLCLGIESIICLYVFHYCNMPLLIVVFRHKIFHGLFMCKLILAK